jgi:hypothetical protein
MSWNVSKYHQYKTTFSRLLPPSANLIARIKAGREFLNHILVNFSGVNTNVNFPTIFSHYIHMVQYRRRANFQDAVFHHLINLLSDSRSDRIRNRPRISKNGFVGLHLKFILEQITSPRLSGHMFQVGDEYLVQLVPLYFRQASHLLY